MARELGRRSLREHGFSGAFSSSTPTRIPTVVDGALSNNLIVSLARELGAWRIIAVEVGIPSPSKEELNSSIAVVNPLSKLPTRSNVERSLASLGEKSVLIQPEVDHIGTGAFARLEEAVALGEHATGKIVDRLYAFRTPKPDLPAPTKL